ncbi:extracellular solute-binding protein [Leucobacter iarius]|uniref:ABC transporter substrate-binding protein n=1 Tax=Leucobacter iarius TaxID=333963 RepID=A0ABP4Y0Y9_9MICO
MIRPPRRTRRARLRRIGTLGIAAALGLGALGLSGCAPADTGSSAARSGAEADAEALPRLDGQRITLLTGWSTREREAFAPVIARFEQRTGARVKLTDADERITAKVYHAVDASNLPDVALIRQPGLLRELVANRALIPLDTETRDRVARHTARSWRALATVDGTEYGVWFAGSTSSQFWSPDAGAGGAAPATGDWSAFLRALRDRPASDGPAISVGAKSGWPVGDWFENLYLGDAGAEQYERLSRHEIPWTDPSVARALDQLAELRRTRGALQPGTADESFGDSLDAVFGSPRLAERVLSGGSAVPESATAVPFPSPGAEPGASVIGGTVAVQLKSSDGGAVLLRYLAGTEAAEVWIAGGGISPHGDADLSGAPNEAARATNELVRPGPGGTGRDARRFDLSDLAPSGFGAYPDSGAQQILREFFAHPSDVPRTQQRLEHAAEAAWSTALPAPTAAP